MSTRILCGLAAGVMACTGAEASAGGGSAAATTPAGSAEAARPPEQYVVIVDGSSSVASRRASTQRYASTVMNAVSFGDQLVVMLAPNEGVASAVPPLASEMPSPDQGWPTFDDSLALSDTKNSLAPRIRRMLEAPPTRNTDLIAALHEAAHRVQGAGGRPSTIILLSDMLQCAMGVCFEGGGRIPDQRWIDQRKQEGVIPNLNRVCVMVIGADASTARGVEVRRFWQRYFAAAGATLDDAHYVHSITAAEMSPCRRR